MDQNQSQCGSCSLKGLPFVPWQLVDSPQYPVLFVGQAPGGTEGLTKVPFTGTAGKMHYRLMKEAGLDKRNLSHTNLVSCPPPEDREPTKLEIELCSGRLKEEIHFSQPELIVALGKPSALALTGRGVEITKIRGSFFDLLPQWEYECPVLVLLHPSFVQRQRQWIEEAVKDYKKIITFFHSGIEVVSSEPNFLLDPDIEELCNYFKVDATTTFDLETTGLNSRKDKILGISFCNSSKDAIACYLKEGDNRWEVIKNFLENKYSKKCTQNGSFDLAFLDQIDVIVQGMTFDTRLAEKMIHSDLPTNLQFLRQEYTDIPAYKPSSKEMKEINYMSKEQLLTMGCWDALTTYQVMEKQKELLSKEELNLINNLLLPLVPCLNSMEKKGVLVDLDTLAGLYGRMYPLRESYLKEFEPIGINPGSPVQICKYFGLKDSKEETLNYFIKRQDLNSSWYGKILKFREYDKSMSTYLKGVYARLEDGRIHTEYGFGTGTLRLNSQNPNLQNVPDPLRVIYIPDSEEYYFADFDAKQLELRILGLVAKIPSLLADLAKGMDPHEELRKIIYSEGRESITPPERQRLITKAVLFGTVYDRTPRSIGREFGVSDAEARSWQEACIYKYPEVKDYRKETDKQLLEQGFVTTPFGNHRYIVDKRQGYNTPIQSTASLVNLTSLLKLYKEGFDLRLTVHDSITIQVRGKEEIMEAKRIMEEPFDILGGYSFPVKCKMGKNWFELEAI